MGDCGDETEGDLRTRQTGESVLSHAREAMLGMPAVLVACTRAPGNALRVRLSPPAKLTHDDAGHRCDEQDTRSCQHLVDRLAARLPLSSPSMHRSGLDGVGVVDVLIPGPRNAWRLARARAKSDPLARALSISARLLLLVLVGLVAWPGVYAWYQTQVGSDVGEA